MTLHIMPEDINGKTELLYEYDKNPDLCPLCFRHIKPKTISAGCSDLAFGTDRLQIVFRCTNEECDKFFIGTYFRETHNRPYSPLFFLESITPMNLKPIEFTETIEQLSPSFVEIYNQAAAAESLELGQIAGMGFRKALEFLIKDFLINQNPTDDAKIKATFLGKLIKDDIDDPRLKSTAERATWLGNDETHYVRKWVDKDINDLKLLIKLSVNWIENVLLTEQYTSDMST